jgi:hypothetical protein
MPAETVVRISHLRDHLGMACRHVARTDEPVVVRRYKREDVAIVPLWEWRFFKRIEAAIRDGRLPWNDALEKLSESGDDPLDVVPPAR